MSHMAHDYSVTVTVTVREILRNSLKNYKQIKLKCLFPSGEMLKVIECSDKV